MGQNRCRTIWRPQEKTDMEQSYKTSNLSKQEVRAFSQAANFIQICCEHHVNLLGNWALAMAIPNCYDIRISWHSSINMHIRIHNSSADDVIWLGKTFCLIGTGWQISECIRWKYLDVGISRFYRKMTQFYAAWTTSLWLPPKSPCAFSL